MTEDKIKQMLKDIIDNGARYGYIPVNTKRTSNSPQTSKFKEYHLGEEINPEYKYIKIQLFYVWDSSEGYIINDIDDQPFDCMFKGTYEECKEWIEKKANKSWLEERLNKFRSATDEYYFKEGAREVCQKILEKLETHSIYGTDLIRDVIKKLGVKIYD